MINLSPSSADKQQEILYFNQYQSAKKIQFGNTYFYSQFFPSVAINKMTILNIRL